MLPNAFIYKVFIGKTTAEMIYSPIHFNSQLKKKKKKKCVFSYIYIKVTLQKGHYYNNMINRIHAESEIISQCISLIRLQLCWYLIITVVVVL